MLKKGARLQKDYHMIQEIKEWGCRAMQVFFSYVMPFLLFLGTFGIGIYNICNNEKFWEMPIGTVLTLLVAISIAYIATQKRNDDREAKKRAERLVEKIQAIVQNEHFYRIHSPDDDVTQKAIREEIQMTNKRLKNLIEILKKYGKKFKFEAEANYIDENFKHYRDHVDSLIMDLGTLAATKTILQKWADNIDSKCEEVISKLYGL